MRAATRKEIAAMGAASGAGAVARACHQALASLPDEPGLLLAFASGDRDSERDAKELEEAAGGAPAAGMTGKGLFGPAGSLDAGCIAMALGPEVKAGVGVREEASSDLRAAGHGATAEALENLDGDADLVLLFIDSTHGDIADTVSGAYEAAGPAVPIAGGGAGGPGKRQFHGGRATVDSIVAVAIGSEGPIGTGKAQTCTTRGTPSMLTRANGPVIEEIDGRPAEEVYLDQLGFTGVPFDDEEFERMAVTHPIAQPDLHGDFRLRHVLGREDGGAIRLATGIPERSVIEFTEMDFDQLLASGADSVRDAVGCLEGADSRAVLVFDCAARRRALGEGISDEIEAITSALGDPAPPLVGLYTHGEVARLRGAKGDRNHAVVTVSFG